MGQRIVPVRVVIDTNVLLSGLLFGGTPGRIRDLWISGRIVPLLSRDTFEEIRRVLCYPKFRLSAAEVTLLVEDEILPYAEVVSVDTEVVGICRDPHDDKFLALAASGKASYLVTGDEDLLILHAYGKTRILTVTNFLALFPLLPSRQ